MAAPTVELLALNLDLELRLGLVLVDAAHSGACVGSLASMQRPERGLTLPLAALASHQGQLLRRALHQSDGHFLLYLVRFVHLRYLLKKFVRVLLCRLLSLGEVAAVVVWICDLVVRLDAS